MRSAMCAATMLAALSSGSAKECSRFVTAEERANVLRNVKEHRWAKNTQAAAIKAAEPWLTISDGDLWAMITSQELPRAAMTNEGILYKGKKVGCPKCGDGIVPFGNYPWKFDFWQKPWKLTCPNCGEVFPKNDFQAFYRTALDEQGMFRRELGDRSLLFNAEHPDPKDPLHRLYVDDGYGMTDEKGNLHHMIAYYCSWAQWRTIYQGPHRLARAYTLTSDTRYAHKAAVLLDRIADVYPEMDYLPLHKMGFQHSQGGTGLGRIEGCIWETRITESMAYAYDHIFDGVQDDHSLVAFCSRKAEQHKLGDKSSVAAICRHIEDHVLLEALKSCKDGRISGNTGMTHTCLAVNAIALDRPGVTDEWLDWLFDPRFPGHRQWRRDPVPWVLVQGLDRDGMGGECGGYGLIWTRSFLGLAEIMAACPEYTKHNLAKDYPKLKQCVFIQPRLLCLDSVLPTIGDSGATGAWARLGRVQDFAQGFRLFRDPRMASLAWRYAGESPARIRFGDEIFQRGGEVAAELVAAAKSEPFKLRCEHLGRYGQAVLQTEQPENGRALWIHYGCGKGHSHSDCLNIGLYAKNVDLLPDLGYPEYTGGWPKRHAWTANTISHNTLLVGDARSAYSPGGKIGLFAVQPPVRAIEVSSKTAYPGLDTYSRAAALIDVSEDDSYVLDVFRARGGADHRLSYHGPAPDVTVTGIELAKQPTGTFAGPDVPFAKLDGEQATFYKQSGFTYLYDVARSNHPVDRVFTVDWKAEDLRGRIKQGHEPHLRLHALTPYNEVVLASGDPPQNKKGNPRRLRYLIQSRLGDGVESQFVSVLEPYDRTPFVRQVRKLSVQHDGDPNAVAAVAVDLTNGATDIVINCEVPVRVEIEGDIQFEGKFGFVRIQDGEAKCMRMCHARLLRCHGIELTASTAAYTGKVAEVDADDPSDNRVCLDPPLPPDAALVGRTIHFTNGLPLDTTYDIRAIDESWVSTGDITIIAGFKDLNDFNAGYRYLVNPGDEYVVPCIAGLDR